MISYIDEKFKEIRDEVVYIKTKADVLREALEEIKRVLIFYDKNFNFEYKVIKRKCLEIIERVSIYEE